MARNDDVPVVKDSWTQLTNGNATTVRVDNPGGSAVLLKATNGAVAPVNKEGSVALQGGNVLAADLTLAQLWPGVAGANRLWAFAKEAKVLSVSHDDA